MASIAKLRFISFGVADQTITIKTGVTYTFKNSRLGFRQVSIFQSGSGTKNIEGVATNFKDAYQQDDNYASQATLRFYPVLKDENGLPLSEPEWILEIEHFDNNFFNGFQNNTNFIVSEVTTTTQEIVPELTVQLLPSDENLCGKYKLDVTSNIPNGRVEIYWPFTQLLHTGTGNFQVEFNRPSNVSFVGAAIVKLYSAEEGSDSVLDSEKYIPPPVIGIENIAIRPSPFGAIATIEVKEYVGVNQNLEYSFDGITYQGSNENSGMSAGNYTAYIKDLFGCIKSKTFTVTEDQTSGIPVDPLLEAGPHNSLRLFRPKNTGLKTFLNFSADDMPGYAIIRKYSQKYPIGDNIQNQFRSSHKNHTVSLVNCEGEVSNLEPAKKSDNIGRVNVIEGNYTEKQGKLAVYFTAGNIYDSGGAQIDTHTYNGTLPNFYRKGLPLMIEGLGSTQVLEIYEDPDDSVKYAVTNKDPLGNATNLEITSIHNEHDYDVFEFDIPANEEGVFITHVDAVADELRSELIEVLAELPDNFMKVQWFNNANDFIYYNTGIRPHRWLEYDGYFHWVPKSERNIYYTDNSGHLTSSKSLAVYRIDFEPMPMEIARGLEVAFTNSNYILLNDVVFIADEVPEAKEIKGSNFYKLSCLFTLVEKTVKGQQTVADVIDAGFIIVNDEDPNEPGYWRIH